MACAREEDMKRLTGLVSALALTVGMATTVVAETDRDAINPLRVALPASAAASMQQHNEATAGHAVAFWSSALVELMGVSDP